MRIDRSQREKDRKKKQESVFEAQVFSFVAKVWIQSLIRL